jgi:Cactus-binding C-terminus of cactin protein/Conserved mid region of cactin
MLMSVTVIAPAARIFGPQPAGDPRRRRLLPVSGAKGRVELMSDRHHRSSVDREVNYALRDGKTYKGDRKRHDEGRHQRDADCMGGFLTDSGSGRRIDDDGKLQNSDKDLGCIQKSSGRETEEERRERKRLKRERKSLKPPAPIKPDSLTLHQPEKGEEEEEEEQFGRKNTKMRVGGLTGDDEEPFLWKKKDSMLKRKGLSVTAADMAARRVAAAEELEKAKIRREKRNRERDAVEAERAREARVREQELNEGWDRKEESFHGQQHFLRQAIRLREGRPSLADTLARNVRLDLLELQPDPRSPCVVLDSMHGELTCSALTQLAEGIQLELDFIPDFSCGDDTVVWNRSLRFEWWTCLDVYVKDALAWSGSGGGSACVHSTVQNDLEEMLAGKTRDELARMEQDIEPRIHEGTEVEFWQAALGRVRRGIATARVGELNSQLANERAAMLAAMPADDRDADGSAGVDKGREDPSEGHVTKDEEAMVRAEMAKGMKRDEEKFEDTVDTPTAVAPWRTRGDSTHVYAFNDKYRPRRPRFFNRVHSGYDWNKYNRTHYDHDNPPPKTVQGYKFNIFYPDLIDRSVAPTFAVAQTDNPDVCILSFNAGPPYEDLAFKIMSRPWEHSHRRGFRCSFDRGILHLWFNFRRLRYRR